MIDWLMYVWCQMEWGMIVYLFKDIKDFTYIYIYICLGLIKNSFNKKVVIFKII